MRQGITPVSKHLQPVLRAIHRALSERDWKEGVSWRDKECKGKKKKSILICGIFKLETVFLLCLFMQFNILFPLFHLLNDQVPVFINAVAWGNSDISWL